MARAIGRGLWQRTSDRSSSRSPHRPPPGQNPASPPILRLHNPSILTRARSARSVTSHSHGEGGRLAPFSMANHWLPFTPAHWFPFTPALTAPPSIWKELAQLGQFRTSAVTVKP